MAFDSSKTRKSAIYLFHWTLHARFLQPLVEKWDRTLTLCELLFPRPLLSKPFDAPWHGIRICDLGVAFRC